MRTIRYILLLIALLPCSAAAQKRTLTLDSAVRFAEEQSIDVRRAQLALERNRRSIDLAGELYLPELTATGDYSLYFQRQVFFVAPGNPFNETGNSQAFPVGGRHAVGLALNFTQPLYDPLRRMQMVVAEAEVEVSAAQLGTARALVKMNAEKAFYRSLYARNEREVREKQIKQAITNLDFTIARYRQGRAMPLDTLTASATLARARADAERARFNYLGSLLQLAQLLDLPDYQNLDVDGKLEIPTSPGPSGGNLTTGSGRYNSAERQLAEAQRLAAQVGVEIEKYTEYPTINAVGRWQALGQSPDFLPDTWSAAMTSYVGVTALYPISNLWRGDPRREEAEIRVMEADLEIERIRKADSLDMEALLLSMQAARAQIVAEEATVAQATKAVEITLILYKEGRATWLEVENSQSRLLDAQLAEERMRLQFLEGYAELKAIVGE